MTYTTKIFNFYNNRVIESRNAVNRHIMYILEPDVVGFPQGTDKKLKELYNVWRADCRAMNAACEENLHSNARHEMIEMPPEDKEHFLCRQMAAVIIQLTVWSEETAEEYLPALVKNLKKSNCWSHPDTCACHCMGGWTYKNNDLMRSLYASYLDKMNEAFLKKNAVEAIEEEVQQATEYFKKMTLQKLGNV
jgi:hypothetical protein